MIVLSPLQEQELVDALAGAFTPADLDHKVADPLKIPLDARSGARDIKKRARALVTWAVANDVESFISTALRGNPSNLQLSQFAESVGLLVESTGLGDVLNLSLTAAEEKALEQRESDLRRQVCGVLVRKPGTSKEWGFTGFLVGDDQVMTVRPPEIDDEAIAGAEFVFEGLTVAIHPKDPFVVKNPRFSVLRLARPVGRALEQGTANVAVRGRGWISPEPGARPAFQDPVAVAYHAYDKGRMVYSANVFVRADADELAYQSPVYMYGGDSGAPCLDRRLRLIGIHVRAEPEMNRGFSIEAIVRVLTESKLTWDASYGIHRRVEGGASAGGAQTGEHDAVVRGIADSISISDVWSDEADDLDVDESERWPWVEAAAVHATFDPATLDPFGETTQDARMALLLESRHAGGRWVLNDRVRKAALARLASRGALAAARAVNPEDAADPLDVTLGSLIRGETPNADLYDPDALRVLITVVGWLDGVVKPLPKRETLLATLERATLLAPFEHLTSGFFAGREQEMADLTNYCEGPQGPPLFLHAPGGMGKSALLARFVLANSARNPLIPLGWRPFVYIDFDRPELDATDPVGVLLAIVRQLGPQASSIAAAAQKILDDEAQRKNSGRQGRRGAARKRKALAMKVAPDHVSRLLDEVAKLFNALPTKEPIVLILDTLEEVQFSSPDAIGPLVDLVGELQTRVPLLRPVLAGRVPADEGVAPKELGGLRLSACVAVLQNELPTELAANTQLVARVAEIVAVRDKHDKLRGNPLSLRLAAEVLRREATTADRVVEELDNDLKELVEDAIVQGRLYERILGHIHDPRVAALAHPGLALRVITWQLIREVLAGPCGLGELDETAAKDLFAALAKEVALVRQGAGKDQLELRPELRRIVREDLAKDDRLARQRTAIHAEAVKFYARGPQPADRAEEIYHRLALGESPDEVDKRWMTGVETFLRDAVGELPPQANAYLASRVGGVADEQQAADALPADWEEYAAKRAGDLLKFGQPRKALDLLAARPERLPTSKLHYVESIACRMLPAPDLAAAESAAERAVAAARASSNSDDLRDALEELVHVRRLRDDTGGVLRALADLANLGDDLGDDLVLLQANVEGLESAAPATEREQFSHNAVRVFNRLPDELVAKAPELSRRVAAQVGGSDPATLQRVMRIVGTGALDQSAARGLYEILDGWQHKDSDVRAYVPDRSKSPYEIASAARHLLSTHDMDSDTAERFSNWLGSVVTPKHTL